MELTVSGILSTKRVPSIIVPINETTMKKYVDLYQGYILLLASFFTHFYLVRHKGTQNDCFSHDVTNKERIQNENIIC